MSKERMSIFGRRGQHALVGGVALASAIWLAACGGGGGTPSDGGGSGGGGGGGGSLVGRLWHNNSVLNNYTGSQIADAAGASAPELLTANQAARPWPDGSQYAIGDYTVGESTDVSIRSTAGTVLYQLNFPGYARNLRPSPVDKRVLMLTWGDDSVSPSSELIVDFEQGAILASQDSADGVFEWLPDGRYMRITATGQIAVATVGGLFQDTGSLAVPSGHSVSRFWPNQQGNRLAVRLVIYDGTGHIDETDLWLADLNGGNLERYTNTKISSYARWAPDGSRIAFDSDTGSTCDYGGCAGTCSLWYAGSSARNILALPSSGDAQKFSVKNRAGESRVLGCDLLAWTD